MSRRAHQKVSGSRIWLIAVVFLLVATGSVFFFQSREGPFRTVSVLPPGDYFENANSLRGNIYQMEGVITSSLGSSPAKGRLFGLRVESGEGDLPLPILIPPDYREMNLQKGQRYRVKVRVGDDGILLVEDLAKA
jgi:hypothetical protein